MFKTKFEVIEIYKSGVRVTNRLEGKRRDVEKDVELFKNRSKDYQMVGKKAMLVFY